MDPSSSVDAESAACPNCGGAGFVHPRLAGGKPDYSSAVPCRCTEQLESSRRRGRLEQYSNLGALASLTFDQLSPLGRSGNPLSQQQFQRACEAAQEFAASPRGWLFISGPSACGKTHLAAAIANQQLKNNAPVLFITVPDLLDHLRAAFAPESELSYDRLFERVRNAPVLIMDDLGIQSGSSWAQEKLDQLLNHRYHNRLPTVITSEMTPDDMQERWNNRFLDESLCQVFIIDDRGKNLDLAWQAGLELEKSMTFQNFDARRVNLPPEIQDNLARAYRLAMDFARTPEGWLVLQGTTGCGKTHLAAAVVNHRYQSGCPALFVVVPEFLDHLRSTFSPESKTSYDQLFERVKTTPLLVLDDFGEQSTTSWAQEKLYQVINYRYNAQLPTVITTSRALEEMEPRISSRLADRKMSTAFNIMAPDYRTDITLGRNRKPYRKMPGDKRA
jgi:DNA replication protein DnaC